MSIFLLFEVTYFQAVVNTKLISSRTFYYIYFKCSLVKIINSTYTQWWTFLFSMVNGHGKLIWKQVPWQSFINHIRKYRKNVEVDSRHERRKMKNNVQKLCLTKSSRIVISICVTDIRSCFDIYVCIPIYLICCWIPSKNNQHISKGAVSYPPLLAIKYPTSFHLFQVTKKAQVSKHAERRNNKDKNLRWKKASTFVAVVFKELASLP